MMYLSKEEQIQRNLLQEFVCCEKKVGIFCSSVFFVFL